MPPEPPTSFLLPPETDGPAVAPLLGEYLDVHAGRPATFDRTALDTADRRLARAGLALDGRHRSGRWELTLHHPEGGIDECSVPAPADRLPADALPDGPVRACLAPVIAMRALLPLAHLRSRLLPLYVLDGEAKTVVRLVAEHPLLVRRGEPARPLRARLRVDAVRGYDGAYARVCRRLAGDAGLEPAGQSLLDEAVVAAGGKPGGLSGKLDVALDPRWRADRATAVLLRRLWTQVDEQLPGTLADLDTEFLHDLRVAVRRSRSLLKELRSALPAQCRSHWAVELKWVQEVTGPTRDVDVTLLEWDDLRASVAPALATGLEPVHRLLAGRRDDDRKAMVRHLRSARFKKLAAAWPAYLDELAASRVPGDEAPGPDAGRPIVDAAAARISTVYGSIKRRGRAVTDASPAEDLHDLRKRGKELRYLLEHFGGLYPAEVVRPMVSALKGLQNVLGCFQDRQVQGEYFHALATDLAGDKDSTATLLAMGALVERLFEQQAEARADFARRFASFTAPAVRSGVASAFGAGAG
ncbi:MAG TPA: CHAD domain-containing protein [Acidimicrobiales bacterium]|nr:CHAD domain-containing protein [Acidimicrobiales bacterium]